MNGILSQIISFFTNLFMQKQAQKTQEAAMQQAQQSMANAQQMMNNAMQNPYAQQAMANQSQPNMNFGAFPGANMGNPYAGTSAQVVNGDVASKVQAHALLLGELFQNGADAKATILSKNVLAANYNGMGDVCELQVQVTPEGQAPFNATISNVFTSQIMPKIEVNNMISVKYDNNNPQRVCFVGAL
ncbi:MAG: hypothetical protein H3C31_01480 [Brumimicrobium sp.]|nr:hypothetical protein [Brumimicrobium sp.]MCO5269398.1 hypothetical protein [Brumimicrobium sp.]